MDDIIVSLNFMYFKLNCRKHLTLRIFLYEGLQTSSITQVSQLSKLTVECLKLSF